MQTLAIVLLAGVAAEELFLFVSGSNTQPILSAALMEIATLVALLWAYWPSVNLVGA